MFKRLCDIVLSLLALAALALPMAVIALLIRIGSKGPALFRQARAGRGGVPFTMLKFRTMRVDTDPYGVSPHSGDDPRLTRWGRFLREKSLDELPQLLNILLGHMSIVGPRPLYERQAQQWDARQRGRLKVRPGLTGYAQAYGRASLTIEEKIEMDLYYVEHQSFWLDAKIIFRTAANLLRPGKIYEKRYSRHKEQETDS
jgi:lipopolysaccharide/colanic/teichoic acid biosynthesis glycosyltransferase